MKRLLAPQTGGDPQGQRKLRRSSLRALSERLKGRACPKTIGRLVRALGYSLRSNIKRLVGRPHPHRDWQYRLIQRLKERYRRHGQPVISVDAKKRELIGPFANSGSTWVPEPEAVLRHDFPSDAQGKATPYGVYDQEADHAWVSVGQSGATAEFAVGAITQWWQDFGRARYPQATHLMIEADAGGCNGHRPRLWKRELQRFADQTGLTLTVGHYPPGASKWNPIEHRLFSQISRNWAGIPLRSWALILALIRGTSTQSGLQVEAEVDEGCYQTGIAVSPQDMQTLNLKRAKRCPDYTYSIRPRK